MADWNPINVYNKHHIDDRVESTNDEGDDYNGSKFSGAANNEQRKDREQRSHSIDQQPLLSEPQREPVQIFPSDFGGYMLHPEHTMTQDSTLKQGSEDMVSRNKDIPSGFDLYRLKTAPSEQKPPGYETDPVLTHDKDVSFFGDSNVGQRTSRSMLDQDGLHRGSVSTLPSAGNGRRLSHQRGVPISGIDDVLPSTNQSEESKSAPAFSNVLIGDKALQDSSNVSSKPAEDDTRRSSLLGMATAAVATVSAGAGAAASGVSNALMGGTDHQQDTKDEMPSTWPSSPSTNEASALGISATEGPGTKNATNCTYEPAIHGQTACFYTKDDVCDEVTKDKGHPMCEHVKEPSLHGQNPSFYGDSGQHNDSIIKNQLPVGNVEQSFGSDQATQTFNSSHLHKNDNSFIHTALPVTNVDQTFSDGLLKKHAGTPDQATQTPGWSNGAGVDEQAAQIQSSDEHTDSHKGLLAAGGAGIGAAVGGILGKNASSKNDQNITGAPMSEDLSTTSGIQSKDMSVSAPVDSSVGRPSISSATREPVTDKHVKKMGGIWSAGNQLSRNDKVSEGVGNAPQANEIKSNKKNLLAAGGIGAAVGGLLNRNNKVGDSKDLNDQSQRLNNDGFTATAPQALANNNFVTAPQSDYEDKQVPASTTDDNLTAPQTLAQGADIGQSRDTSASQSVYDDSELPQTWGDQVIPVAPQIATDSETYNTNVPQGYDGDDGVTSLPHAGATQSDDIMNDSGSKVTDNSRQGVLAAGAGGAALGAGGILGLDNLMSSRNNKVDPQSLASTDNQEFTDAPQDWSKDNDQDMNTDAQGDLSWSNDDNNITTTAPQAIATNNFKTDDTYKVYGDKQVSTAVPADSSEGLITAPQVLAQSTDAQSQDLDPQSTSTDGITNDSNVTDNNHQGVLATGATAGGAALGAGGILGIDNMYSSRSKKADPQCLDSTGNQEFTNAPQDWSKDNNITTTAPQALANNNFATTTHDDYGDEQVPTSTTKGLTAPQSLAQGTNAQDIITAPQSLAQGTNAQDIITAPKALANNDFKTDTSYSDYGDKQVPTSVPADDSHGMTTAPQVLAQSTDSHQTNKGMLAAGAAAIGASLGGILGLGHRKSSGSNDPQSLASHNDDVHRDLSTDGNQATITAPQALANNDFKTDTSYADYGDKQVPTSGTDQGSATAPQTLAQGIDVQGTDAQTQNNSSLPSNLSSVGTDPNGTTNQGLLAAGGAAAGVCVGGILGLGSAMASRSNNNKVDPQTLDGTTTQGFSSDVPSQDITTAAPQALANNDSKSAPLDDYGVPTNDDSRVFDNAPQTLAQGTDDQAWSKDDFVTTDHTVSDDSHHGAALAAGAGGAGLGSLAIGNKEPLSESQTWSTATQGTYSPALAEVEDSPMTPMNHNAPKGWLSNSDGQTPQAIDANQSIAAVPQDTHSNDIGFVSDQGMATTAATTGQGANEDHGITSAPESWSNDTQGVTTAPQALANNDGTTAPQSDLNDKQVPTSGPTDDSQGLTTSPQMLATTTTQGDNKTHKGDIAGGVGAAAAAVGGMFGLHHHVDDTHPLSKTSTNRLKDSESISSTRATTGKIVPSVRNQDEIKDRHMERHENFKGVTDSIDSDHRHIKATRKNSLTQGFKTKAAAATGAFTNAVRRLSSHGSGGSGIKKDQIHVRRMSDAEMFKNQTLQEGQQHAFGGNAAFDGAALATLPNVIPHQNLPPTTTTDKNIPRTFENINGQDASPSVETTHARLAGDQIVPSGTVESTQAENVAHPPNNLGREAIPEQDILAPAAVPQHTFIEEPNSLGIHDDPNSFSHLGEPTAAGDHGAARRGSSASSEHLKYTGVNQAYARIPGVYSMKPAGTNDVGQDAHVNFIKNEQEVNKNAAPTKSSFFSGHVESRRGSIQKTVGKLFRNGSMQDKGALKQISGQEKINAYNATHNKL